MAFIRAHNRDQEQYSYIEQLAENWKSKWSHEWDRASEPAKTAILESIADAISSGIARQYYGDQPIRKGDPIDIKFVEMKNSAKGSSHHSTIMLNTRNGIPSKEEALKIIAHEATHHAQYVIKRNLFPIGMTQEMWLIQGSLGTGKDIDLFGIKADSNAYIRARSLFTHDPRLRHALYTLQFVERQARQETLQIAAFLGINAEQEQQYFKEALNVIKDRYNCHDLTNEQILDSIDNAQYCLFSNSYPQDYLTASILYDMVVLIKDQELSNVWANNGRAMVEAMSNKETKAMLMTTYGYEEDLLLDEMEYDGFDFGRG